MYSEIKISGRGNGTKGYVEVYVDGIKKRFVSGKEMRVTCLPN